jgi:hypothetical protein
MADPFDPHAERQPGPRAFAVHSGRLAEGDGGKPLDRSFDPLDAATGPMSRHAAEWGLAALLTGGVLTIIAPVVLLFNLLLWNGQASNLSTSDLRLALVGGVIGVLSVVGLCMVSMTIGARAIQSALTRRQPAGLALAGSLVSAVALILWLITGTDLMMILISFNW